MADAFGIVVYSNKGFEIEGLSQYRSMGATSFLGRYRLIDFPLSSLTNSGIENIQLYVNEKPRSIIAHVGAGRQYNINTKRGELKILFDEDNQASRIYQNDVHSFNYNRQRIEEMPQKYVVITSNYMLYTVDFNDVIKAHEDSGADITMMYKNVNNADEAFINCDVIELNRQKGVKSMNLNLGGKANCNISMDTYIMNKDIFLAMIDQAVTTSSLYWMRDMVLDATAYLDIRGYQYKGYLYAINSFKAYFDCSMDLLNINTRNELFDNDLPVYTKTNDSSPAHYFKSGKATGSLVSNGCLISGTIENSIISRGCIVEEGAVVRNSIILPGTKIGKDVVVEYAVVDKNAVINKVKKVEGTADQPVYIKRSDRI
ncbi:glucose-1-phosphate adenylyltransferase [Breznakia blatticola]|uniref:Glucose-1-phosphate adenylyltransferase n=1 Tax=Breznakia blatticola TaxID=1754012 RepID=A0A4R7ZAZ0_9FIRM|nr:glucose-1-phosphate adenylyltransferase subunit GlgD [Breznakia blatticola]TDW14609.1 glucose-1-phosphate adenylyltransferase [Breznakia blatticola]